MRSTSVNGASKRRRNKRAPIGEFVASRTPSRVASRRPDTDSTSSRWLCATRSMASSVAGSQRAMRRAGSGTPGLHARAKRNARATARRALTGRGAASPASSPNARSVSAARSGASSRTAARPSAVTASSTPGSGAPSESKPSKISRGRARLSSANAAGTSGSSAESSSPVEKSKRATPTAPAVTSSAAKKLLALDSRCSRSVTSPGVITRTTSRGTMPLTLEGSAICSQMATL